MRLVVIKCANMINNFVKMAYILANKIKADLIKFKNNSIVEMKQVPDVLYDLTEF